MSAYDKRYAYVDGVRAKELDRVSPPQWRYLHGVGSRSKRTATRAALIKQGLIVKDKLSCNFTAAGVRALRVEWRATP